MQDGVELAAGPRTRYEPTAFDRGLAAEDIADIEPLRTIDIHRIADAGHLAAVGRHPAGQRQRGQAQIPGNADECQIVARQHRDDPAIDRFAAAGRDDADLHSLVTQCIAHHMRIGDHRIASDREAGAMADREQFAVALAHDHHPHHAARGRVDIRGFGVGGHGRQQRREQRKQRGDRGEKAGHCGAL